MDYEGVGYYTSLIRDGLNVDDEHHVDNLGSGGGFGNQLSDLSQVIIQAESTKKQSRRSGSFTPEEDELLVSAWLNISTDPIHGNDQKINKYWDRVHEYFHTHKTSTSDRTSNSLLNRWSTIQLAVNKFCGCYAQICARRQSGINEQDKIHQAKMMYFEMYKSTFNLENCWNKLKLAPKWLEVSEKKKKPKKATKSTPSSSSVSGAINVEEDNTQTQSIVNTDRPPGTKAEKRRLKQQKDKETMENSLVELIEDMREEKKKASSTKTQLMEKLMAIHQRKEEDRIMSMDLSNMSSVQAEYYKRRQQEILDRM